jgi:hypothetical protein
MTDGEMIPEKFVPDFNVLLAAARAWVADDQDDAEELARIEGLQSAYTKGVECLVAPRDDSDPTF